MDEHFLSETCIWWMNGWQETLLLLKEKMEAKALLGSSCHLSQEHFLRGSAVHCKALQPKARLRNISGYQNTLSQAGVILYLEEVRKQPMHRQGRSPQGLHPAMSVHCSSLGQGSSPPGALMDLPMEFCHSSEAEDMVSGEMEERTWQTRQEGRGVIFGTKGALILPSFQLEKRRVENREMRGNCPLITNTNGEPKKTDFTRGLWRGYHKVSLHLLTHIMSHSKIRLSRELSYEKLSKGSSSPK